MRLVTPPCWTVVRQLATQHINSACAADIPPAAAAARAAVAFVAAAFAASSPALAVAAVVAAPSTAVDAHDTIMSPAVTSLLAIMLAVASAQGLPASLPNVWGGNASAPAGGVLGGCSGQLFGFCTSEL